MSESTSGEVDENIEETAVKRCGESEEEDVCRAVRSSPLDCKHLSFVSLVGDKQLIDLHDGII